MKNIKLGSTTLEVPAVAVGCMRIDGMSAAQTEQFIHGAMELGTNFFDHADIYGDGKCEELFGSVLKGDPGLREKIILQSKAGIVLDVMYDNSKEYLVAAADRILKRLNTEYLDVFLIHRPDTLADPEDTAIALDELVRAGKVRYVGVSNHRSSQIRRLEKYLDQRIVINQLQLSVTNATMIQSGMEANMMTDGAVDRDGGVLDYCMEQEITIQTWSPFQYGFFDGTFLGSPKYAELNKVLDELAEKYGTTNTAIAAAWILRHPANMQIIAGTTKLSRLKEICEASELVLTKEEWYRLYLAAGHMLP